jgi:1-deoxy-D-xylulose-5-phosphate synthase
LEAAKKLAERGIEATVVNARYIKPLDEELILAIAANHKRIVTLEEAALIGGFGSAVMELFEQKDIKDVTLHRIGVPDKFIDHGSQNIWRAKLKLDAEGIVEQVLGWYPEMQAVPLPAKVRIY